MLNDPFAGLPPYTREVTDFLPGEPYFSLSEVEDDLRRRYERTHPDLADAGEVDLTLVRGADGRSGRMVARTWHTAGAAVYSASETIVIEDNRPVRRIVESVGSAAAFIP